MWRGTVDRIIHHKHSHPPGPILSVAIQQRRFISSAIIFPCAGIEPSLRGGAGASYSSSESRRSTRMDWFPQDRLPGVRSAPGYICLQHHVWFGSVAQHLRVNSRQWNLDPLNPRRGRPKHPFPRQIKKLGGRWTVNKRTTKYWRCRLRIFDRQFTNPLDKLTAFGTGMDLFFGVLQAKGSRLPFMLGGWRRATNDSNFNGHDSRCSAEQRRATSPTLGFAKSASRDGRFPSCACRRLHN